MKNLKLNLKSATKKPKKKIWCFFRLDHSIIERFLQIYLNMGSDFSIYFYESNLL